MMEAIQILSRGVVVTVTVEQQQEVRGREISWAQYSQHRLGADHGEAVKRATRYLRSDVEICFRDVPQSFTAVYHRDFAAVGSLNGQEAPVTVSQRKASVLGGNIKYTEEFDQAVADKLLHLTRDYTTIRKLVLNVGELGIRKAVEKSIQDINQDDEDESAMERPRG